MSVKNINVHTNVNKYTFWNLVNGRVLDEELLRINFRSEISAFIQKKKLLHKNVLMESYKW